jgi:uncharacterized protein (TIGR03118 family)
MTVPSHSWSRLFRPKRGVIARQQHRVLHGAEHRARPGLEYLEDRYLLSGGFTQVNLASDVPGLARVTDPNLVNPWGIAFSPTGPFWFADNGAGVSDLLDGRGEPIPLVVTIPSTGPPGSTPTGTVFNSGPGFVVAAQNGLAAPSRFLFATEDGTINGWAPAVDPTHAVLAIDNSSAGAVYKGLTLAIDSSGQGILYAADFSHGTIDVFDQHFRPIARPGAFQDPNIPSGFAPFNIQNINNQLFVTYAQRDGSGADEVAGPGRGFIDVYDTDGRLLRRFASGGALDSPWGLALAPAAFGPDGGALLVGNNGDGHINAFNPSSGAFLGPLADDSGNPIAIPNLWALMFGNGHAGGASDTLFFAAGVGDEHGLFGALQTPERRGADTAGLAPFDPQAPGETNDYPLPPAGGPALGTSIEERPIPISDLLPLRESSLALIPTLSITSQPGPRTLAPVPGAPSGSAFSPGSVAMPVSGPSDPDSPPGKGDPRAVALDTFLDLSTRANVAGKGRIPQPESNLHAVAARRWDLGEGDRGAETLLAEPDVERSEARSGREQGREALPPSGQADERATGSEDVETQDSGGWTTWGKLLVVLGFPVVWVYWLFGGLVFPRALIRWSKLRR